jgi:hypothetical protein
MRTLILSCKDSILASEILSAFSKIFRSNQQELKSLTINYNGLPKHEANIQIQVVKSIIESFVSSVCNDQIPSKIKLLALKNLKWLFKGRESEIVQAIDI